MKKVLRIKLRQNKAAYTKEETVDNRLTYPLPPFSTIIGALHNACGYQKYHPMDISVQGKYGAMQREVYLNHGLLNSRHDDRNILVYLPNPDLLTAGYTIVGEGLKSQGNSFLNRVSVRIYNEDLYKQYVDLEKRREELDHKKKTEIQPEIELAKKEEKLLKEQLKALDKKSPEAGKIKERIQELKRRYTFLASSFKEEKEEMYNRPTSHFRTLVKSLRYQEVLYDVELIIHIQAEEETIEDIQNNLQNLVSIGRSEDFVDVLECKLVKIGAPSKEVKLQDGYKMYINKKDIISENDEDTPFVFVDDGENKIQAKGTVYYLNKNYEILKRKRVFQRVACLYSSYVLTDELGTVDQDGYLVNLN